MTRFTRSLTLLALLAPAPALLPLSALAQAQGGIDCRAPGSATLAAICADPRLAELQNWAAEEYQAMALRLGDARAQAVAAAPLRRRDACGGDPACIEAALSGAITLFMESATAGEPPVAPPLDPFLDAPIVATPLDPTAGPALDPGLGPSLGGDAAPDRYPVGPDGLLVLPVVTAPPSGWLGDTPPEGRLLLGPPIEAAGPSQFLRPPPPLEGAFEGLPEADRQAVQVRLALAGLGGEPDGVWGPVTEGALRDAAARATRAGRSVDLATEEGAAAFLAYVRSPDFEAEVIRGG